MSTLLHQTPCWHCDGAGLELHPDGQVQCRYCGQRYNLPGICPRCEHVSAAEAEFCENCQRPLSRVCPNCQARNWSGLSECAQCGRSLDTLDHLIGSLQEGTDSRLYRQQRESAGLKLQEEQAAERRLEQLRAIDERRLKAQNLAMAQRSTREQQITTVALIILGVIVIAAAAILILAALPH